MQRLALAFALAVTYSDIYFLMNVKRHWQTENKLKLTYIKSTFHFPVKH